MPLANYNLICVAHPDDESIFFGGTILTLRRRPWRVVCMTDGNADGQGQKRKRQFLRACRQLGVEKAEWWAYPDLYERRLPVDEISDRLKLLPRPHEIFTHGIVGEYGHPHHQDVSFAAHQAFAGHRKLYSVAYNCFPERRIEIDAAAFALKANILMSIYGSETSRFLNLLPATFSEGFSRIDRAEVKAIYEYLACHRELRIRDLDLYRWLAPFLRQHREMPRPF